MLLEDKAAASARLNCRLAKLFQDADKLQSISPLLESNLLAGTKKNETSLYRATFPGSLIPKGGYHVRITRI